MSIPCLRHLVQRAHLAQAVHFADHQLDHVIDLLLGVEPAEAEADAAVGQFVADAQRPQDVARLQAGADVQAEPLRHGHVLDAHHQPLALDVGEADVQRCPGSRSVGWPLRYDSGSWSMMPLRSRSRSAEGLLALVGHLAAGRARTALPKPTISGTGSVPERMPRSWPPPSICGSSRTRGSFLRTYSAPMPFGPYILWAVRLSRSMPIVLDVDRHLADRLHRVGVEQDALLLAQLADGLDRLERADLVVRGHDA